MNKKWNLWLVSIGLLISNILTIFLLPKGSRELLIISDLLPIISSGIALFCVGLTYRKFIYKDNAKTAWLLIFMGSLFYFAAELIFGIMEVVLKFDMNEFIPSLADYFWCIGYIPFFAALFLVIRGFRKSGLPLGKKWVYRIIVTMSIILLIYIALVLLRPMITDEDTSAYKKLFYLYYPIMDLFVVALAFLVFYISSLFGKGAITMPWRMIAIGFILFTIADLYYSYYSWMDVYQSGDPIEIAWNMGYMALALGSLYQRNLIESLNLK